jgi:MFS family permease
VFIAATLVGGAALQWPIGRLSDAIDRRVIIGAVASAAAVAAALLPMAADMGLIALTVTGFFAGGLTMTLYPLSMAHTHDWLEPDQMTAASSALVMVYGAGAVMGPIGTGVLMGLIGPSGFAYYLIGLCLLLSAIAVYRITRREAPDSTEDYLLAPAAMVGGEYWAETAVEEAADAESDPA